MKKRNINIKSRLEIQELFKKGQFVKIEGINIFYRFTSLAISRILITFPKVFKGAVKRNRVRRVFKECFREYFTLLKDGCADFIFVVYPQKANINYHEVKTILKNMIVYVIKRKV
ncbi:Ribonuclease P protein component [Borrelia crocidurae DOU]|uniref:Ribonuclease P protein component n=1 Tax=Borrelia crocidurae DOU TaxID=1293575 RepID=W5SH88_9SPIR|nr:ribonuclease P protein component [Borrelia crocidurae]AHH06504.1 Ribonuclease P protein component [Borrelia crocidurae DOU]